MTQCKIQNQGLYIYVSLSWNKQFITQDNIMCFHAAPLIQRLVKLTFQIACTSAGRAHFRPTCGLTARTEVHLNKMGDNNIANFGTSYGDIYGEPSFHKVF